MRKILKIILMFFGTIFSLIFITLLGLNILKFAIYSDYYDCSDNVCKNPGLNDGYVPQGIAVSDEEDLIITSGYMTSKFASRIYITNSKNEARYIELYKNGKIFTGHVGGVALSGDNIYLSNNKRIYEIKLEDILNADKVDIGEGIKVNNNASFIFADDNYIYTGEFHDGGKYVTNHEIKNDIDTYYAICTMYDKNDLSKPLRIYSIPNNAQGFCVTKNGTIVISTSRGLSSSKYYIYNNDDIKKENYQYEGVDLYILNNPTSIISGPAMSEDLSYANDKVYCLTESASNKYIFGKFFFAYNIYAFNID